MFVRVRTLVTLETMSEQLFRRPGSTRSCLSSFLMSVSLFIQVVNFRRDCTGFELRITKLGTQQSQLMLLYRWNKTDIQVDVDGFK